MRILMMVAALMVLPVASSCGALKGWVQETTAEKVGEMLPAEVLAEIDTDNDAKLSWGELKTGSGALLVGLLAWWLRRKQSAETKAVEAKLKGKTGDLYAAIAKAKE